MRRKYYIIGISALVVAAGIIFIIRKRSNHGGAEFEFDIATVERGKIFNAVMATGTLEALETVEVGTQVSGVVKKIYVDYNSLVTKGQVLARIDETPLKAQLNQSQASVDQALSEFNYQKANYVRNKPLHSKKLISQADFDQVEYSYNLAKANLASSKAQHDKNLINLKYATIASPIDGVILDRAVDEGQTVAASFNTPTLFTIANDLTQMKVEANVDEADIGLVKAGQRVEFSVDAFPGQTFSGEVTEVRLQPVITNNVVTYTVIIDAPNPDKDLMPGMTATATIFINEAGNQLLVPLTALEFNPTPAVMFAWNARMNNSKNEAMMPPPQTSDMKRPGPLPGDGPFNKEGSKVWIRKNDSIFMLPVKTLINDGINTAIEGVKEGDQVILDMQLKTSGKQSEENKLQSPFMPQPPKRR